MDIAKINWYPGHMKKAFDDLLSISKHIDFVIEVLDARSVSITTNKELEKIFRNKPIIRIALKQDLSDLQPDKKDSIIFATIKQQNDKQNILKALNKLFATKINQLKQKGLLNPTFIGIVVGIPNVGKSSLINYLCFKKTLKTENRSGVTKRQETRKINDTFYLIDTPGVLFKKIDNFDNGAKLVILNNIKRDVVPIQNVLEVGYTYFCKHYYQEMQKFYGFSEQLMFDEFVEFVAKKFCFMNNQNSINLDRTYQFILDNFSNANICKFHFE